MAARSDTATMGGEASSSASPSEEKSARRARRESTVKISDLMQTEVVTTAPDESLRDAARRLVQHGISGMPVCDEEWRVLGMLSEGDILYKERDRSTDRGGSLGRLVGRTSDAALRKAQARTVGEAMTTPPVTIEPSSQAAAAARLMLEKRVNRLPVVLHDGQLVGIVTRTDLVRAFVRPDDEIGAEIRDEVLKRILWVEPGVIGVTVRDGDVQLAGELETQAEVEILEKFVQLIPGVVSVQSTVTSRAEDTERRRLLDCVL